VLLQSIYKNYESILEQARDYTGVVPYGYSFCDYDWKISLFTNDESRYVFLPLLNEKGRSTANMIMPDISRSGKTPKPNYLSDQAAYVLKVEDPKKDANVKEKHLFFVRHLQDLYDKTNLPEINVILNFLHNFDYSKTPSEILSQHRIVFEVDNSTDYFLDPLIVDVIESKLKNETLDDNKNSNDDVCLVSGSKCNSIRLYNQKIKNLPGTQTTGYCLLSNNDEIYTSYGLDKWKVSPISLDAAHKVYVGLNSLLHSTRHSQTIDNFKLIWFSEKDLDMPLFQDPTAIKDFITAFESGHIYNLRGLKKTSKFNLFCLKTNFARILVEFPYETTVESLYKTQYEWLQQTSFNGKVFPLWQLKNLFDKKPMTKYLLNSAFFGHNLPLFAVTHLIDVVKSKMLGSDKHKLKSEFACLGLLKFYCFKKYGINMEDNNQQLTDNAFVLGRLFAEYQSLHEQVNPNANGTVTRNFLKPASTSPEQVFRKLDETAQMHLDYLKKIDNKIPAYLAISKRIDTLMCMITNVPKKLTASEQVKFILGLHYQKNLNYDEKMKNISNKENQNEL
jgi:CRISPR-associated protein Csd1